MPTLFVLRGADKGRTFETPREPAVLGRQSDQIPLTDNSVSRRHAEIRPINGDWLLTDLESSNGTYLNGVRIDQAASLNDGDQIKLGGTLLVFAGEPPAGHFSGLTSTRGLVQVDRSGSMMDSSILSAVPGNDDSLILAAPETAEAVHAWKVMYQLAELIGAGLPADQFLERVTDVLTDHLVSDRAFVLMRDEETGELSPRVVRYRGKSAVQPEKITASQTIIHHVQETKEGVLCANAMADHRFSENNMEDSIHRLGLRSVICVPVVAHEEVHGVIHLDCSMSHHTYTNEQLRLATAIGRMTGMAIENSRLIDSRMQHERLAAVGETVAHLSHFIRNILQGLRGGAEVLEIGLKREALATVASGWPLIQHNLDRIYQLTSNMLTFSKERQPAITLGQLNRAVEDAVQLCQRCADEKGVMLLTDLADDIPAVPLDMEGMTQVASNVLGNAIDAAPETGGRVNVRTAYDPEASQVGMFISDNGPGIPADEIEFIFDAFHSTKGHGGTGLGLAAARKIVNELGGEIEVESASEEGTVFHIYLPLDSIELADSDKTHGPAR